MGAPLVAALDLGTTVGWCIGTVGKMPRWGAWRLAGPAAARGARFGGLSNMISDMICENAPTFVLKEAPLLFAGQTNGMTARWQYGLHASAEEACWRTDTPLFEEEVNVMRKAILGRARWPKGVDPKTEVMGWCNAHGYAVSQPDAADAIVAWLYATSATQFAEFLRRKDAA